MDATATLLDVDPVTLLSFDESLVFNNCNQQQGGKLVNHYATLSEIEREMIFNRIDELEKEFKALKKEIIL